MKKGGFLRNVLDTIRSNQANQSAGGANSSSGNNANSREFGGQLKSHHFSLAQVARHGFPENPTALAFDPVQKIAAIGTKTGALRVFGRPGVDVWAQHKPEYAVTHIRFVINQGAIITVTADESIHLWSLRGPNLRLQHSQNSSPSTSSSPAQVSHSPAPQQQTGASASSSTNAATTTQATKHVDSEAQPGDPDYLADQLSSGSPNYDKSKQYPRQPEILHTLKFQREHITCLHQTLMSKWLYIGTERGNVHVANVETFELSGYSIAWNKAIELCRKTHPGSIIHISECPQDTNKLLIGYESGCIVLWDLKGRNAEGRYYHADNLLWLSWHHEGKQFVAAHGDGSLVTWQTRSNARPVNILHPHAKTPTQSSSGANDHQPGDLLNFQQQSSSFVVRALNNELYRPINKVDWRTSRNNEQFLLFSGGLPYDGIDGFPSTATNSMQQQQQQQSTRAASVQPPGSGQSSAQQYLRASSASHNPSPISPSISPANNPLNDPAAVPNKPNSSRQTQLQQQQANLVKERRSLRSTSLTVMYGKSITVLEMDDTIIDFITICDNSPYENDTSDPLAVIILLSNDLIVIDLTSSGYPSFDSPYPSANLNESPVTCVQYLADCSSDLIPFLYSTSQNVVSRVPKKGFSDKEWPINGGEWGQQMQSYPELVLTGHADGTIKFWDISGVNFDLISKIKTSKFFERPNKLRNSAIVAHTQALLAVSRNSSALNAVSAGAGRASSAPSSRLPAAINAGTTAAIDQSMATLNLSEQESQQTAMGETSGSPSEEYPFAIEKIEYYHNSKHLVVAGALSQVIQFRINKKESQGYPVSSSPASGSSNQEIATIFVEPTHSESINQPMQQQQLQKHLVLKVKNPLASGTAGSSSGGSSSSSSGSNRARSSGFQAELICLTPSILLPINSDFSGADQHAAATGGPTGSSSTSASASVARQSSYHCVAPPKVTALALQAAHNILAYAHENGIVLVDIIQKCVIMCASLSDLYGGASMMQSNRDISIQPFATSSILQHHYQATGVGSPNEFATSSASGFTSANNSEGGSTMLACSDNGPGSSGLSRSGDTEHQQSASATKTKIDNENGFTNNNGAFQKSALGSSTDSAANQLAKTTDDNNDDDDDDDNNGDNKQQQQQASELSPAKDHVEEEKAIQQTSPSVAQQQQQQQLTSSESRSSGTTREPTSESVVCSMAASTTIAKTAHLVAKAIETNANEFSETNAINIGIRSAPPPPRARLVQAKSVSGTAGGSGEPHDWQPVAPPRTKKRQSVPFARVPGELIARHNAAFAGVAAVAAEVGAHIEEAEEAVAPETSSSKPMAANPPLGEVVDGAGVLENDNKKLASVGGAPIAKIDNRCAPPPGSVHLTMAPISNEPQAVSSVSSPPPLPPPTTLPLSVAAIDHQNAPSAGSGGAGSTISSIFSKLMDLPKSRFTANSAFQRQLSTTALQSESSSSTIASAATAGSGSSKGVSSAASQPRLFQRQMTASQLFNHSSQSPSSNSSTEAFTNKQRAAALLASARANNPELASSTSCLTAATTTSSPSTSSSSFMPPSGARPATAGLTNESGSKKIGKKRIISRMLSISAIHTTPSSLSGLVNSSDQSSSGASASSAATTGGGGVNYSSMGSGGHNGTTAGPTTTSAGDQVPDKIDSSFTRSRSSSTSSLAAPTANAEQSALGEIVQCLCFLDWSLAMATSPTGLMVAPSSSSSSSSAAAAAAGGGGAAAAMGANYNSGTPSSAANNKSLGSPPIGSGQNAALAQQDTTGGQLALWLGTSLGSVLLVHLQMPDNEDNRVLQLQSVNAEPIPQASIKLPGAILCLATFTSELQSVASPGGGGQPTTSGTGPASQTAAGGSSSGPQSTSSMVSMDLGDSSPATASSLAQGGGGGGGSGQSSSANVASASSSASTAAAAANHQQQQQQKHLSICSPHSSFDSRSSLFLAIVSEKEAKIYQIPSPLKAALQQQTHKHHLSQQQQQQSSSKHHHPVAASGQQSLVESSPLGKLLTNKQNCISKMDISDSSYACRSSLVQMRQPDETCLVSYLATGSILVHCLPQLKLLMEADFVPHSNQRIGSSMCFSRNGHCLYQPSRGEISKFTVSSQYRMLVNEMTGLLYVNRDMPEMPRANFFKSLFSVASSSVASKQSDRDELFGENSAGKPSRGVAKHIGAASSSGMDKLRGAAIGTMGYELRAAREGLDERGEKLGEIEDRTLQMMNQSETYAQSAHQLAQKFKEKKWYQF